MWPLSDNQVALWGVLALMVTGSTTTWLFRFRGHPMAAAVLTSALVALPGAVLGFEAGARLLLRLSGFDVALRLSQMALLSCLWWILGPILLISAALQLMAAASVMAKDQEIPVSIVVVYAGHVALWVLSSFLCLPAD